MMTLMVFYAAVGIILILIAIPLYLEKIPPNGLYGFRVRKTLENPDLWYPVNKVAAGWLALTGAFAVIASVVFSFIPGLSLDAYAELCLAVFAGVFIVGLLRTMRYLNSL